MKDNEIIYDSDEIELKEERMEIKYKKRKLFRAIPKQIIDQLNVKYFWSRGITGSGINVAIFDTGLEGFLLISKTIK